MFHTEDGVSGTRSGSVGASTLHSNALSSVSSERVISEPTDGDLYRKFVDEQEVTVVRFCSDSETVARLLRVNPALISFIFGVGTQAFLDQFLKLWPQARIQALPYLSIPAVAIGALGWGIGAHSIVYPKDDIPLSRFKRTSVAMLEGTAAVFPGVLGEEIEVYCSDSAHLNDAGLCMVSDSTFLERFIPAPAALTVTFIAWNMISPAQKNVWASQSKGKKALVICLDTTASLLLYSRIIQALLMNISTIPQPLIYEYAAIPAAIVALVGQTLKPQHRQKLYTGIMYAMGANLLAYLIKFLMAEFSRPSSEDAQQTASYSWSAILKSIAFPLFCLGGVAFTVMRSRQYVTERQNVERYVRVGSPRSLLKQQLDEALQRSEVRQYLVAEMLKDERLKKEVISDPIIIGILMQDSVVKEQLMRQAGFVDVDIQGTGPLNHSRNGSVSMHLVGSGDEQKERRLSDSGLSTTPSPDAHLLDVSLGSSAPHSQVSPILTAYQQHQRTQPSLSATVVPDSHHPSHQHEETHTLLKPNNSKKNVCILM